MVDGLSVRDAEGVARLDNFTLVVHRSEIVGISSRRVSKTPWAVGWEPLPCRTRKMHWRWGVTLRPRSRNSWVNSVGVFNVLPQQQLWLDSNDRGRGPHVTIERLRGCQRPFSSV